MDSPPSEHLSRKLEEIGLKKRADNEPTRAGSVTKANRGGCAAFLDPRRNALGCLGLLVLAGLFSLLGDDERESPPPELPRPATERKEPKPRHQGTGQWKEAESAVDGIPFHGVDLFTKSASGLPVVLRLLCGDDGSVSVVIVSLEARRFGPDTLVIASVGDSEDDVEKLTGVPNTNGLGFTVLAPLGWLADAIASADHLHIGTGDPPSYDLDEITFDVGGYRSAARRWMPAGCELRPLEI